MNSAINPDFPGFETITVLEDTRDASIRARNTRTGAEVVIKLLDRAKEPVLPKRFDRGRRLLRDLTKRGIGLVPLLGNGVATDGRDYIISPYYPLGSLEDQIMAGPTPWRQAAELVSEIATIVGVVHADGLVLGDLRPSNVFLQSADIPAVAAFGVATRRFDDGGPVFGAPETGGPRPQLTPTSDVYSLSLIFGALITGRARARNEPDHEFMAEIRTLAPQRIVDVLDHGLAPSPTNRYRNAGTMQRAIRAAIEADPDTIPSEDGNRGDDGVGMLAPFIDVDIPDATTTIEIQPVAPENLPPGLEDITFVHERPLVEDEAEAQEHTGTPSEFQLDVDPDTEDFLGASNGAGHEGPGSNGGGSARNGDRTNDSGRRRRRSRMTDAATNEVDRPVRHESERAGSRNERDLVTASVASSDDQTSVLRFDDLTAEAEDTDKTGVLQLDDLTTEAEDTDKTGVLQLDDLTTEAEDTDKTGVLQLDDLTTEAEDTDKTGVLQLDDLTTEADAGQDLPADDLGVTAQAFIDDETNVFGEDVERGDLPPPPPAGAANPGSAAAPFRSGAMPFDPALPSDEIPFQSVERNHKLREASTWKDKARVAVEVAWFRSRRALGTTAAVLGLLAIAATIIYFLAQEVQSGTKIQTEGDFQTTTTAAPSSPTTFVATNVPLTADRPSRRTTTTVAPPPPETRAAVETDAPADQDEPESKPDEPTPDDEVLPPETEEPAPPTSTEDTPGDDDTDSDPDPPQETTVAPPAPEPPAPEPPVTEPPPDAGPPPSVSLNVSRVGRRSAVVAINSNQCVAMRFVLSGGGDSQSGSTPGFDPAVACSSSGWRLDFSGSSRLQSGTNYTLNVWVRAEGTNLTNSNSVSFTTTEDD